MKKMIIAIDGPSGTGKSTTARLLGKRMNIRYIDSGTMYRGITHAILKSDIKRNELKKIIEIAKDSKFEYSNDEVFMNDINITKEIKSLEVMNVVSSVSKIKELRNSLVDKQRRFAEDDSLIMDGKDIGTVVFLEANFKFFLICDLSTRAARRREEFLDMGYNIPVDKIIKELKKRDEKDMKRAFSPLKKAKDAIEVDTTHMIIEEQVDCLCKKIISNNY